MLEKIKNALFKIHVKRFLWYIGKWIWCWDLGTPAFVTRFLVLLAGINAKTAAVYTDAKCKAEDIENTVNTYSKADTEALSQFLHTV